MIKVILCVLFTAAGGYIGFSIRRRCRRRSEIYKSLCKTCVMLASIMRYERPPLAEALVSCAKKTDNEINEALFGYAFYLEAPKSPVPKHFCNSNALSDEEQNEIDDFLKGLGKTDVFGQSEYLTYYEKVFELHLKESEEQVKKKGEPAAKLGILAGVFLSLLTI
jgi:stage III sporulation protein AB